MQLSELPQGTTDASATVEGRARLTSDLMQEQRRLIGDFARLDEANMLRQAKRLLRRYRIPSSALSAEDTVQGTLLRFWQAVLDGRLRPVGTLEDFGTAFNLLLGQHVRDAWRRSNARKHGGLGRPHQKTGGQNAATPAVDPCTRRELRTRNGVLSDLGAELPVCLDLVITKLSIDEFIETLSDPLLEGLLILKIEGHTNLEIARRLNDSPGSIQHKMRVIRGIWRRVHRADC
jgi:DNA-directed RNA polymerase specialized sigma24 family protein